MIYFISTWTHRYTQKRLAKLSGNIQHISYPKLFLKRRLPVATYIFSDLDRLSFWHLELAGLYYQSLSDAGAVVLNNPKRSLQRLALLRQLHREGINRFQAWPAHDAELVDCFPVFLRTEHAHRGAITGLIHDADALAHAIADTVNVGFPLSDLMVVEFCAQPLREGFYQKPAFYRVGECLIASPSVHQAHWLIREGRADLAQEEDYQRDLHHMRENRFGKIARKVFDMAHIEFGRTDLGVVDAAPQFYEINTNPYMPRDQSDHPSATRREAFSLFEEWMIDALRGIDLPKTGKNVQIDPPKTVKCDRRFALHAAQFWSP